jgi:hypothetical protein
LKDENLPFEKSVFASAVKKSLQDGISKIWKRFWPYCY